MTETSIGALISAETGLYTQCIRIQAKQLYMHITTDVLKETYDLRNISHTTIAAARHAIEAIVQYLKTDCNCKVVYVDTDEIFAVLPASVLAGHYTITRPLDVVAEIDKVLKKFSTVPLVCEYVHALAVVARKRIMFVTDTATVSRGFIRTRRT